MTVTMSVPKRRRVSVTFVATGGGPDQERSNSLDP